MSPPIRISLLAMLSCAGFAACAGDGSSRSVLAPNDAAGPDATVEGGSDSNAAGPDGTMGGADSDAANARPDASGAPDALPQVDSGPLTPGDFTVNLAETFGSVNRQIYGHNWLSPAESAWGTVGRYGGNPLSVFNEQSNYYNSGSDYYYKDMPMSWSNYANWEDFVDAASGTGTTLLVVVPTLGWIAKGSVNCSYPYSSFSNQQDYEPTYSPDGGAAVSCAKDPQAGAACCGNGKDDAGNVLDASLNLDAAYVQSSPADTVAWLQAIQTKLGNAGFAKVMVGLDNEPDWWNVTHHDIHPQLATIAEIWAKNQAYAAAIKAAFPNTPVLGPDLVGWFHTSDVRAYLTNVATYKAQHGIQLIDYLDLHFYPSYYSFSFGCDQVPSLQRLQGPRLLWDPTYANPYDGITTEPVRLIPRYKQMIADTGANVKLAITEYNLGTDACAAGAVAQAEALAVFGRYGLDLAARWSDSGYKGHYQLTPGSPVESAFRMFLDHDVTGTSVGVSAVGAGSDAGATYAGIHAYAVQNGSTLNILFFNTQPSTGTVTVQLGRTNATIGSGYQFSIASAAIAPLGTLPTAQGGLASVTLPPTSATLLVARLP